MRFCVLDSKPMAKVYQLSSDQTLPINLDEAWDFFSTPSNLEKLTPKDIGFKIISSSHDKMVEGQIIAYKIKVLPMIWVRWVTEITHVKDREYFVDDQRDGPYKMWHHRHTFREVEGGVEMNDEVHYIMPFGIIGRIAHCLFVKKKLENIFAYRAEALDEVVSC